MARIVYAGVEKTVYDPMDVLIDSKENEFFDIEYGSYAFALNNGIFSANNMSDDELMKNTTATTKFVAKKKCTAIIHYDVYAYKNDIFAIYFNGVQEQTFNPSKKPNGDWVKEMEIGDYVTFELQILSSTRYANQKANLTAYARVPNPNSYTIYKLDKPAKKLYVGVPNNEYYLKDVAVTAETVASLFKVHNDKNFFEMTDGSFSANNIGQMSTSAVTRLTALDDIYNLTFRWRVKTEATYDRFKITKNGGVEVEITGEAENTWTGSLMKNETIVFSYEKDLYGDVEGECAVIEGMVCTVTDYDRYDVVSRARRGRKGYIGNEEGIARPFFGHRDMVYRGVVGSLYSAEDVSAGQNNAVAIFAGGYQEWDLSDYPEVDRVYCFDRNLTRHIAEDLQSEKQEMSSATAGRGENTLFFSSYHSGIQVEAYDTHLVHTILPRLSDGSYNAAGITYDDYAVFVGGSDDIGYDQDYQIWVHIYDGELTLKKKTDVLTSGNTSRKAGTKLGKWGMAVCGSDINVFDDAFTFTSIPCSMEGGAYAASTDSYALFMLDGIVDVVDKELTRFNIPIGSVDPVDSISIGGMVFATDGINCETYDDALTVVQTEPTVQAVSYRGELARVGDYVLIGGRLNYYAPGDPDEIITDVEGYKLK